MAKRNAFFILILVFLSITHWLFTTTCHGARTEAKGHVGWSTPPIDEEEARPAPDSPPREPSKAEPPGNTITLDRKQYESLLGERDGLRKRAVAIQDYEAALKAKEDALGKARLSLEGIEEKLRGIEESNVEKDKELSKCIDRASGLEAELTREKAKRQASWWQRWFSSQ